MICLEIDRASMGLKDKTCVGMWFEVKEMCCRLILFTGCVFWLRSFKASHIYLSLFFIYSIVHDLPFHAGDLMYTKELAPFPNSCVTGNPINELLTPFPCLYHLYIYN